MLLRPGARTVAVHQGESGAGSVKPTRLMTNAVGRENFEVEGMPALDSNGIYTGPLPRRCSHGAGAHQALTGRDVVTGASATKKAEAYPENFCHSWARRLWDSAIGPSERGDGLSPTQEPPNPVLD